MNWTEKIHLIFYILKWNTIFEILWFHNMFVFIKTLNAALVSITDLLKNILNLNRIVHRKKVNNVQNISPHWIFIVWTQKASKHFIKYLFYVLLKKIIQVSLVKKSHIFNYIIYLIILNYILYNNIYFILKNSSNLLTYLLTSLNNYWYKNDN